jgi:hypothetical protein
MKPGGIHIGKVSLRLRGVTSQQARQRAGSLAREIAEAVGSQAAHIAPGRAGIGKLSVRVKSGGQDSNIAEQIRRQLAGE